jgi:hypothetical protein
MGEESPLLLGSQPPKTVIVPRKRFLRESTWLVLVILLMLGLSIVATVYQYNDHGRVLPAVFAKLSSCISMFLLLTLHGLYIWKRGGGLPLIKGEGAKYITTAGSDGRTVEYFIWGSEKPTVILHGSNVTQKYSYQYLYLDSILKEMNVNAISPSYPGHSGSDTHPFCCISNWPKTDLEPILNAEKVTPFMVQGSSYGTAHAMATAVCYYASGTGWKCVAMGLDVPYLPEPVCGEFGFRTDADLVLTEAQIQQPWTTLPILLLIIVKGAEFLLEGPAAKASNPELFEDCEQSFMQGTWGQSFKMLNSSTNQHCWQDPRNIIGKNDTSTCVWGHFTFMGQEVLKNAVMTRELLQLLNR